MRRFLRKSSVGVEPLAVTMSGVRLGERALQIGIDDPGIAAAIAAKTGLTGLATIVVADEAAAGAARAAVAETGALADVHVGAAAPAALRRRRLRCGRPPRRRRSARVAAPELRERMLAECRRVLRAGGRLIALEAGSPTGLRGLFGGARSPMHSTRRPGDTTAALEAAGFRAVRTLGRPPGLPVHRGPEGVGDSELGVRPRVTMATPS